MIQSNLCPAEYYMDVYFPSLDITSLRYIYRIRANIHCPNLDISFSPEYVPNELICLTINSIQSKATTTEEQAIGHFSKINLKRLTTWDECEQG